MTEPAALQKLLTWLSPAFPVGAFAWSAGLETAIAQRVVTDAASLQDWIAGALAHGGIRTDAILLAEAHRTVRDLSPPAPAPITELPAPSHPSPLRGGAGGGGSSGALRPRLQDLADLCLALTPARERHAETSVTGNNFAIAARAWPSPIYAALPDPSPYPIAVGAIAGAHGIGLADTLLGYLTATAHGQVSVAVRLVPLGQTDGLRVMAALEPQIAALADAAATATLADIGGIAYAADIAQMRHETLEPRDLSLMIMGIAALIFIPLLSISIAHLLWSLGRTWPIRDEELLARTVVGRPGITKMPPRWSSFLVAVLVLAAGVIALSLADETAGGTWLTTIGALLGVLFVVRGVAGYTQQWRAVFPGEPFATLDRKNYSPLALFIGAGFLLLVLLRLT